MKLRRMELVILALTLAFAFFMGGFFTGRSRGSVSITATAVQPFDSGSAQVSITAESQFETQTDSETATAGISITADTQSQPQQSTNAGETSQGSGAPQASDGKININTATHGELTDLPGIGTALATRIIDYRSQHGSFAKIEDIQNVSGIGERRYEAIMDLIKVG